MIMQLIAFVLPVPSGGRRGSFPSSLLLAGLSPMVSSPLGGDEMPLAGHTW